MRDRRTVDELSLEELERLLIIRRREARQAQINRLTKEGRVVQPTASAAIELPPELADAIDPVEKHINVTTAPVIPQKVAPPTRKSGNISIPTFDEDERLAVERPKSRPTRSTGNWGKRLMNFGLLAVEIIAVIGLVLLGRDLLSAREDLVETTRLEQQIAQQTRSAQLAALPTAEPTAILKVELHDWILPGGHTFTDEDQPMVNFEELLASEIPRHLLTEEVYAKMMSPPRIETIAKTDETAVSVRIPRLGLDEPIVQGTDWESLKAGVGQVLNGANPGDVTGTVSLAAHNDIYGELFRHLDQLQVGDEFVIVTTQREYTYRVREAQIVDPTDVWVLTNTGVPTAVLISCYPHRVNNKRIIVFADRID